MSPLMAFKNSVKITLLSLDNEKPQAHPAQPAVRFTPPTPEPEVIARPVPNDTIPVSAPAVAPVPTPVQEISQAAAWHARAGQLRTMTDTLPSDITRTLMPKIVALYDALAREEGWSERDTLPPPSEEPQREAPPADEELPEIALSPAPRIQERLPHPRRPEALGRRTARRRG
jgi:hypothetical protein